MSAAELDDPDLPLLEVFNTRPELAEVFFRHGMLCFGCEIARFHTIADACAIYGLDDVRFRAELRRALDRTPQTTRGRG